MMSDSRRRKPSLGVAERLAILLIGLAGLTTGLALILQDRALNQDLESAARSRLERSAYAVDRLLADHLRDVADRYAAISQTPEFRANLDVAHGPTLRYFAAQLLDGQAASYVGFLGADARLIARAGDPQLARVVQERISAPASDAASCAAARDPDQSAAKVAERHSPEFGACRYPDGTGEATLVMSRGELYALTLIPLRTGGSLSGGLASIEPVTSERLAGWSDLSGGTVRFGAALPAAELDHPIRVFPGLEIRIATTYEAERAAIKKARRSLAISGIVALALSLIASLFLARGFARPIVQMREATLRVTEGRLDQRLDVDRGDEIGQLGRAFNQLVARLRESQERLRRAQRLSRFGNWYMEFETLTVSGTEEFLRLFAIGDDEVPLSSDAFYARIHEEDRERLETAITRSRLRSTPFRVDVRVRTRSNRDRIIHLRGQPRGEGGTRIEASAQDVTERRSAEDQIRYLSLHDPLTGLGNREYLRERLKLKLRGKRDGESLALLTIGLDDFQAVNHSLGHSLGDSLIGEVARRLTDEVAGLPRRRHGDEELTSVVVRLGDDGFGVILDGIGDERGAAPIVQNLLSCIARPYSIDGEQVSITASIGIALLPDEADDPDTLIRNGDNALHQSRQRGPGRYRFFDQSMHADASRRLRVSNLLRRAIDLRALELHYQPRVRPESREVLGFEALARWTDPELGKVSPEEFIPIAESTGSIAELSDWCIETAAHQLQEWHALGFDDLSISVNLARLNLNSRLVNRVLSVTENLDRAKFELEVTESLLIEEGDEAIGVLAELRKHGFRIALDDFGTGYSSLSYLQGLPLDAVKIDRSFIRRIARDSDAAALTGSMLSMCHALSLHTVVEGVQTKAQCEVLLKLGCDEAQGFLFGKPMRADRALAFLRRKATLANGKHGEPEKDRTSGRPTGRTRARTTKKA